MDRSHSNQVLGARARSEVTVHHLPPLPWRRSFSTACPVLNGAQLSYFACALANSLARCRAPSSASGPTFSTSSGQSGSSQSLEAASAHGPYSTPACRLEPTADDWLQNNYHRVGRRAFRGLANSVKKWIFLFCLVFCKGFWEEVPCRP